MNYEPDKHLEELVDRELRKLPDRQAPATLVSRVMTTITARVQVPWYRRAWSQWPVPMRVASATASVAVMAALVWSIGFTPEVGVGAKLAEWTGTLRNVFASLSGALETVLRAAGPYTRHAQIGMLGAALLLVMMYLTCIGLGTAVYRVARRN